ncbi:hypothetical protein ACFFP0_08105 [Rhizobium puerariae]|uniref:Uncharacterized protein n=1 Tax=Rhizobium puerariae TaxID=1585791 RepID=A0ABV6AE11_9HYPH
MNLRGEERWVDCAKAESAYRAAQARNPSFTKFISEKLGAGPLTRIRGTGKNGKTHTRITLTNIRIFAELCGVRVDDLIVAGFPQPDEPGFLTLVTIGGVNHIAFGDEKYEDNGRFSFGLRLNLIAPGVPFILLGFRADYIAPDGCYCLNGEQDILVNDVKCPTAGNFLDFREPVPISNGIAQIALARKARPPLTVQKPVDCDYGEVCVTIRVLHDRVEETTEHFFAYRPGGDLVPIKRRSDPPLLNRKELEAMLAAGAIGKEEFERATWIGDVDRYHVLAFPQHCTQVHPVDMVFWDVTPEYREFLQGLLRKARAFAERLRPE